MKKILFTASVALLFSTGVFAESNAALSLPGYFGSINNNTGYVIECSQVIGGYCANNPMPANGYLQMLPDPGSNMIRGHVMAFDKNVPGKYVDNLIFTYTEQKSGLWKFNIHSVMSAIDPQIFSPDTVVLQQKSMK